MRAAGIDAFGDAVRMLDLSAPSPPAPDEVVISVHAAGVGNWDEIVRVGDWDVGHRPPLALGVEAAGIVDAVGEDVAGLAPGDEVLTHPLPLRYQGAWADAGRKTRAAGSSINGSIPTARTTKSKSS